ncbi:MAG: SDR family oxidoreductase [Acidobacteriota bacterium]
MDRRVLITGTSSGIGLATAVHLAQAGWQVVATMRDTSRRASLDAAARAAGVGVDVRPLDVTSVAAIEDSIAGVERDCGPIDALVNNAGAGRVGSVEHLDDAAVRQVMDTNFFGVWNVTRAVLPRMRARGRGRVVTVTSIGGLIGQPFNDAYCAAKFAVEGMMEALAPVARELGIHVSVVEPGPVHTNFVQATRQASADVLAGRQDGYDAMAARYFERSRETFATHGQTGADVAAVIQQALVDDPPHLRYLTSPYVTALARRKYADVTGDGIVEVFAARLKAPRS